MPRGFAPKFGIDAIFVAGVPSQAPSVSTVEPAAAAPRVAANGARIDVPPVPPRIAPSQRKVAAENRASDAGTSPRTKAPTASPQADAKAAAAAAGSPTFPTIINRRESEPANTSAKAPHAKETRQTTTVAGAEDTAKSDDSETRTKEQPAPIKDPQTTGGLQNQSEAGTSGFARSLHDPVTVAVFTLALLSAILIAGFVLLRRRDASQARVATSRDIGSVWLEESRGSKRTSSALVPGEGTAVSSAVHRPSPPQRAAERIAVSNWGDAIPQTRDEALRVLGIGVSSDANPTAIKKIVDGLRMSWHPDHANGDDDRRIRELRLKQVNAAWEIISEARAEERA